MDKDQLIFDWSAKGPFPSERKPEKLALVDETLRDGLQCPSIKEPSLDDKIKLIHLMNDLGIDSADIGLPGAGESAREQILLLAEEMNSLNIKPNVACRTIVADIEPVVEMSHKIGKAIEVCAFIGSSPIRAYAEDWELSRMETFVKDSIRFAKKHELPVMFVTEDTVRSTPEILKRLNGVAINEGADRLCICDTVGGVTPTAVKNIFEWYKSFLAERGAEGIELDWHGHRDRGLGLINTLTALSSGASRAHACAQGIGERAGNTEMDLLLVNLKLLGWIDRDLKKLGEYVQCASKATGRKIRKEYPVFGEDAFETATGVHAAAVIKAIKKGDKSIADLVYSGVPAGEFGLEQTISIGPMSGKSNVVWFLENLGHDATEERVQAVLNVAKKSKAILSKEEVLKAAKLT